MERFGLGVVGCGDIGWTNAIAAKTCQQVELRWLCDVNIGLAQQLAGKVGVRRVTDSFEEMLDDPSVQIVLLSVPHHLHKTFAILAAQKGKHILIEKPLANSSSEAAEIIRACRDAGVKMSVNFSFRYSPFVAAAKKLVVAGALGSPTGVSVRHLLHKGRSYWAAGFFGRSPDAWRASREKSGGGILIMSLVHSLDYIEYILGRKIVSVYADYESYEVPGDVEDAISLTCRFEGGALGSWYGATCYKGGPVVEERFWGTKGSLQLKPEPSTFFLVERHGELRPGRVNRLSVRSETKDIRSRWIDRFVSALIDGEEPEIGPVDGWHSAALIEAAYRSRENGRVVSVLDWESFENQAK